MNSHPAILVFLKAPRPGEVKTRLAKEVGNEIACGIYRQLVERQLAALPPDWPIEIHFAPASACAEFIEWLGPAYHYHPQSTGDLGIRLQTATAAAFAHGHFAVILIGGDCPDLNASTLEEASRILKTEVDVVIGPATDGGYYLLGLSKRIDSLFDDIPWSGPEVARLTGERATAAELRLAWLEEKEDVDDFGAYRRANAAGSFEAVSVSATCIPPHQASPRSSR